MPFLDVPSSPALRSKRRLLHCPIFGDDGRDPFAEAEDASAAGGAASPSLNSAAALALSLSAAAAPPPRLPFALGDALRPLLVWLTRGVSLLPEPLRRAALKEEAASMSERYVALTCREML